MKKITVILSLTLIFLFFSFSGFAYVIGDVNSDNRVDLTEAINALQVTSGVRTALSVSATINVPADVPTIQEAINAAAPNDTILIAAGTYSEVLTISKDNIVLQGSGKSTTIIKGNSSDNTITISNSKGIGIKDLSIQGGNEGISLVTSSISCSGIASVNNSYGVAARYNSVVNIDNSEFKLNSLRGIAISGSSSAKILNSEISQNPGMGIQFTRTSSGYISNSVVSNNGDNGIQVGQGSSIYLIGNQINSNQLSGLDVTSHSMAQLMSGNVISGNADGSGWRAGIGIYQNSAVVMVGTGSNKDSISGSNGPGIYVSNNSDLLLNSGNISNNNGDGITLWLGSTAQFAAGASITSNTGYGINCGQEGDNKLGGTAGNLSSNTLGTINCPLPIMVLPNTKTFAVCVDGRHDGDTYCNCSGGRQISNVRSPCNVTSDTGGCTGNSYYYYSDQLFPNGVGACCVCAPQ
jgi:hypothetical protein